MSLLDSQVNRLVVKDTDMHGRRVRNASPSEFSADYVIKSEISDLKNILDAKLKTLNDQVALFNAKIKILQDELDTIVVNRLVDFSITAPTTIIVTPVVPGQILVIRITMDVTGHTVSWDSNFLYHPSVPTTPSKIYTIPFIGVGSNWVTSALGVVV